MGAFVLNDHFEHYFRGASLFKMLKGNSPSFTLKVGLTETLPVLLVPLDGFKEAYNYISKKCSFENNPGFFRKLGSFRDYRSRHFI